MQSRSTVNPARLEVLRQLFTAVAEEMGGSLRRAAYSPNIKERRDYSCAVFHPEGPPVAMGDHMPVHLGAMPMSVDAVLRAIPELAPGDVAVVNDPFHGGTHLPDLTLVAPVSLEPGGHFLGYVAARAHHSDVGGMSPGSMPLSREIFQEGLRIPPVRLLRNGARVEEVWSLLLANVRTPREREGDLDAQIGALHTGAIRLREMAERRGPAALREEMEALLDYADRLLAQGIALIPDGRYTAEDHMEDDGAGNGPLRIQAAVEVRGEEVHVDFQGTADQTTGGINAVAAITHSAVRYVVRCVVEDLLATPIPAGGGRMAPLSVSAPEGSLVNALPPAGVAAGNVETSQRITDVVLRAFALALPQRIPGLSQGTMNNVAVGGIDPRSGTPFTYYETAGGGMGAGPTRPGLSGVHVHMSNTLNTPVEALEHAYPFRIERYQLRRGSGGRGRHAGGEGLRRDLRFLGEAEVTVLAERRVQGPEGAQGGEAGRRGETVLIREGQEKSLPGKVTFRALPGDILSLRTPGGGGWGPPAPPDPPAGPPE
jgi:N-methylhydantoinase B